MTRERLPFLEPDLPPAEILAADFAEIVRSGRVSNGGPFEDRLALGICRRLEVAHCVPVANATLGLMLLARALALPGRRFALLPSFTFPATALAMEWAGLEPILCDIDADSWQPAIPRSPSPEIVRDLALVVLCNTFGAPADIEAWKSACTAWDVPLIVDSAAGLGGAYHDGRPLGAAGVAEVFSMHATKSFGVGEGGLVVTDDDDLAARLRTLRNFGLDADGVCVEAGLNAKLSELHAAVACRVLERFDDALDHRRRLAEHYRLELEPLGLRFQPGASLSPAQAVPASLPAHVDRDEWMRAMDARGVETRRYFSPALHEAGRFAACRRTGALDVTSRVAASIVSLPMSARLDETDTARICAHVAGALAEAGGR